MDELDRQICELAHQLDEVQLLAALTTAAAMHDGLEPVAALAMGNIVLVAAGPMLKQTQLNSKLENV